MCGKELKIVYMGTPDFAVEPLRRLVEGGYNVVAVVTMPDKPAGRGQKLKSSAVKEYALSTGLNILQPEKLNSLEFIDQLKGLNPDLGIVVAFKMLPTAVWSLPRLGTFNLHASLLPDYRGAAPINWAIINGDNISGITTFMLNKEIDTGDIIDSKSVEIEISDTAGSLHDKLMLLGGDLVLESVETISGGGAKYTSQSTMSGFSMRPAPKIFKQDCKLDFNSSVVDLHNKVRGLSPYPAAWCEIEGESYKIFASRFELDSSSKVGELKTDNSKYLKIGCNDGYLLIDELQMSGKRRMPIADLLRGKHFGVSK